jgi:hypothetical protein
MLDVAAGTVLHGHQLQEKLGGGHYGEVWRAQIGGRAVALKIFTGQRPSSHLKREVFAQYALGRLEGPDGRWFPRVEHLDLEADPPYVRMELVEGATLEALLDNPTRGLEERLAIGEAILRALEAVHRHDFVHGDLSPQNVIVTPDGSVRLIDVGFGALFEEAGEIALSTTSEDRSTGVASPLYSAPERFKTSPGESCGKASDVFSFGKLLYRLITGEQPFVIKPVSLKFRALGSNWDEFLFRCLEERPEARFPDAGQALEEYRRIYRPALKPGEYRAECPECRAAQSIPGGWAGERFDCRACSRKLEVLFYDDGSRYATTALVAAGDPAVPPPILFIEGSGAPDARAKKFCTSCGGEMRAEAKKCRHCGRWLDEEAHRVIQAARPAPRPLPSFVIPALLTFAGYWIFWIPGAILNWYFLDDALRLRRQTGRSPRGLFALQLQMAFFVLLPVFAGTGFLLFLVLGLAAFHLA